MMYLCLQSGSGESGESEQTGASRGKIILLKKKVEDLEQQLQHREQELQLKVHQRLLMLPSLSDILNLNPT